MSWPAGWKHTPEAIEKMRAAKRGKKHTPETKAKMRAAKLGIRLTAEQAEDYQTFMKAGYSRIEAFAAMGVSVP